MPQVKDYYKILGISKSANDADIKRAYRKRARETHPDKHAGHSDEEFKLVSEAYQVLLDPHKRHCYDSGTLDLSKKMHTFRSPMDIYMEVYGDEEKSQENFYKSIDPFRDFFSDAEFRYREDNPYKNKFT